MAPWLSQILLNGLDAIPNKAKRLESHNTSLLASDKARYSDEVDEVEVSHWVRDAQPTGPP